MRWILFLASCLVLECYWSQVDQEISLNVINFNTKNGLPNSNIQFTFEDKNGFVWVGTRGGLARFDGYHFQNFYPDPNRKNYYAIGHFTSFLKKTDTTYILGTLGDGLFELNSKTHQIKALPQSPKSVTSLYLGDENTLWVGTLATGFYRYSLKTHQRKQFVFKPIVHSFREDWDNNTVDDLGVHPNFPSILWLGCRSGLYSFNLKTKKIESFVLKNKATEMHQYAENAIKSMFFEKDGTIWMGHFFGGLTNYDIKKRTWKRYFYNPTDFQQKVLSDNIVLNIKAQPNQKLLLSTAAGPMEFDKKTRLFKKYILSTENQILKGDVAHLMVDSKGNIWVSQLYQQGLSFVSKSFNVVRSIPYPAQKFQPDYYASSTTDLYFSARSKRYFMTLANHDGLLEYDENFNLLNTYAVPSNWKDKEPFPIGLAEDEIGNLWINDIAGKLMIRSSKSNKIETVKQLPFKNCSKLIRTKQSFFLAQTDNGIFAKGKNGWEKLLPHADVLPKFCNDEQLVYVDKKKLYTFNLRTKKSYFLAHLPAFCFENNNYVHEIFKDSKKRIWIPLEYGGIYRFDLKSRKLDFFNSKDGISSNSTRRVIEDHQKRIFLLCQGGLFYFNESVNRFIDFDGLVPGTRTSWDETSIKLTEKGELMLSKQNAAQLLNQQLVFNYSKAKPIVTSVLVNKVSFVKVENEFVVPDYQNAIQVSVSNFDYAHQSEIIIEYRLGNRESKWNRLAKGSNQIVLNNLSEGNYKLNYRLAGHNQFSIFAFTIESVWYKSQWFYIGLTLLLIAVGAGFSIFYLRKRDKERNLERKVAEFKLKALQAQLNPHFLFNCLTSISGLVKLGEYQRAENTLHDFAKLMRKILTLSDKESIPLKDEIDLSKLYLNIEKVRKDQLFDYTISYDETFADFQLPPMTLQPFLENCVKHAFVHKDETNQGQIVVSCLLENGKLVLRITDNGVGWSSNERSASTLHVSRGMDLQILRLKEYFQMQQQKFEIITENTTIGGAEVRIEIEL